MTPYFLIATVVVAGVVAWLRWGRYGAERYLHPPDVQACVWDWAVMMAIIFSLWAWIGFGLQDAVLYGTAAADVFIGVLDWLTPAMALAATANYLLTGIDIRRELTEDEEDEEDEEDALFEKFIKLRRGTDEGKDVGGGAPGGAGAVSETGAGAG